jgi:hypothetical protein
MDYPVYKIVVNEDDETGVEFVSLVDKPAIKKDFLLFQEFVEPGAKESEEEFISRCIPVMIGEGMEQDQAAAVCYSKWGSKQKFESYEDYPEAAKENAKVALRWAEENGWGDCGTAVGKIRANQLANGEAISRDTIARMAGFERHRQNSDKELGDGCGRLMWLAWGGDEGVEWAQRKLSQIDKSKFAIQSEEKRIISGPIMLANVPIYRYDDIRGEYYVTFPPDTIFSIVKKMARKGLYKAVNTDHTNPVDDGVHMIEMYLINRERGVMPPKGYEDAEDGSAFASYLIDNEEIWTKVKAGEWKGFSVEGMFDMEQQDDIAVAMREIAAMLKNFAEEIK